MDAICKSKRLGQRSQTGFARTDANELQVRIGRRFLRGERPDRHMMPLHRIESAYDCEVETVLTQFRWSRELRPVHARHAVGDHCGPQPGVTGGAMRAEVFGYVANDPGRHTSGYRVEEVI